MFKVIYDRPVPSDTIDFPPLDLSMAELQAMDDLMLLWEEGHTDDPDPGILNMPGFVVSGVSFPPPVSFKPKSRNFPLLHTNPNIWAFVQQSTWEIQNMTLSDKYRHNLSPKQRSALKELQNNPLLVIKPADKGGNVVVMNVEAYERMCLDILDNRSWYRPISKTLVENYIQEYYHIIFNAYHDGTIDQSTWNFLNIKDPRIPTFYSLPKIHKSLVNPPGRPIVSGCLGLTENASALVDQYLQPHVISLSSFIKDTIDLLRNIDGKKFPPGTWLVALDVESLYNSIPHAYGIQIIQNYLKERGSSFDQYSRFVLQLLTFILTRNIFLFGNSHFLQVQGVAMGTKCAPAYANLYLGGWERWLFSNDLLMPLLIHAIAWYRYIDDILILWSGTKTELQELVNKLAINEFNLSFTMECSQECINFLDLTIHINQDGLLYSSLYRKPSAGNTLLHASSAHPRPLLNSIPYSQFLRLRRNCTHDSDFHRAANDLRDRLLARGYSRSLLKKSFNRAVKLNRTDLIHSYKKLKPNEPVRLITKYSSQHGQVRSIVKKYWPILCADKTVNKHIKPYPQITFRRAPSLKDHLVSSHFDPLITTKRKQGGTFACGKCDICCFLPNSHDVPLPNGRTHTIKYRIHCKTIGVVYLALCRCGCFYVGKTKRPFFKRIRDHVLPTYKKLTTTALNRHIGLQHDFDAHFVTFYALDHVPPHVRGGNIDIALLQLETRWIHTLDAVKFPGLNEYISYKSFL